MSAEILRAAATRLRETAEAATPGPWIDVQMGSEGSAVWAGGNTILTARKPATCREFADATYIALMSPPVGLAVADWLEATADRIESRPSTLQQDYAARSLAVARAVLGGAE